MSAEYQAYLFRFQRNNDESHWRVYVENAETGEVWRFATEWELLRFLMKTLAVTPTIIDQHPDDPPSRLSS